MCVQICRHKNVFFFRCYRWREVKLFISGIAHSDLAASECFHSFSSCLHSPPHKRAPHKPYFDSLDVILLFKIPTSLYGSCLFEKSNHNWPNEEITACKDQEDRQKLKFISVTRNMSWIAPSPSLSFCLYRSVLVDFWWHLLIAFSFWSLLNDYHHHACFAIEENGKAVRSWPHCAFSIQRSTFLKLSDPYFNNVPLLPSAPFKVDSI